MIEGIILSKQKIDTRKQKYIEFAILLTCMLLYPVLSMFWHHEYPLASPDFFLLVLLVVLFSSAFAAALITTRSLIVNLSLVLLIALVFMIQFNLLLEGLGITLLPKMAVDAGITRGTRLTIRPLAGAASRQIGLAWRKSSSRAQEFALLAAFLRDELGTPLRGAGR